MHVNKPQRPRLGQPYNNQVPPHFFFDFSQNKHLRSLSIPTGKHKSKFSPLTLLSFLLRKELRSSLKSLLSNPQVHTLKERQDSSHFLFTLSQKLEQSRNSLPLMPMGPTPKRKKTLSSSLPLILLGPATRKGKSFHAREILFLFSPQEPKIW